MQMVFLVGGGSKSCYWTSLLANALRLPLRRQSGSDLGAARMGMMASNPTADVGTNCVVPPVVDVIEPRLDLSDAMQSRFGRFRKLYIALRPSFSD